mmetsp:Transcript_39424/g.77559  ORF Transcript_39424/g.77559 Transcript_39424/m.77559 type:complete len:126 (-) Transcript_39424:1356-1733(-)
MRAGFATSSLLVPQTSDKLCLLSVRFDFLILTYFPFACRCSLDYCIVFLIPTLFYILKEGTFVKKCNSSSNVSCKLFGISGWSSVEPVEADKLYTITVGNSCLFVNKSAKFSIWTETTLSVLCAL